MRPSSARIHSPLHLLAPLTDPEPALPVCLGHQGAGEDQRQRWRIAVLAGIGLHYRSWRPGLLLRCRFCGRYLAGGLVRAATRQQTDHPAKQQGRAAAAQSAGSGGRAVKSRGRVEEAHRFHPELERCKRSVAGNRIRHPAHPTQSSLPEWAQFRPPAARDPPLPTDPVRQGLSSSRGWSRFLLRL